jgi:hypothetical protein
MKAGVGMSPSPAHSGITPSRDRPWFITSTMPLSGAARACARKASRRDAGIGATAGAIMGGSGASTSPISGE